MRRCSLKDCLPLCQRPLTALRRTPLPPTPTVWRGTASGRKEEPPLLKGSREPHRCKCCSKPTGTELPAFPRKRTHTLPPPFLHIHSMPPSIVRRVDRGHVLAVGRVGRACTRAHLTPL